MEQNGTDLMQYNIILAALLHDIGKFKQRAYGGVEHSKFPKSMQGIVLPNKLSHRHALWTYDFFENDLTPIILDAKLKSPEFDWNKIKLLAAKHHNPEERTGEQIISDADRISASTDRVNDDENHYKNGDYLKKLLKPVFRNITLKDNVSESVSNKNFCYKFNKLSPEAIFSQEMEEQKDSVESYKELWKGFVSDLKKIFITKEKDLFISYIINLLEKYTWCIPSATNDKYNDISLFDHSITTMTFALSLFYFNNSNEKNSDNPFILFSSEVSGIQSFIFQNQSESFKGNSKVIRARSFYISILTEAYYLSVCRNLGIPPFTKLINAGGKFICVLPNTKRTIEILNNVVKKNEDWLFKNHYGTLSVLTDYSVEANIENLKPDITKNIKNIERFPDIMVKVHNGLEKSKVNKFAEILKNGGYVIDISMDGRDICKACDIRPEVTESDGVKLCGYCRDLKDIGKNIVNSKYLAFTKAENNHKNNCLNFFDEGTSITFSNDIDDISKPIFIYKLGYDDNIVPEWHLNNYVALENFEVMSFENIAKTALVEIDKDNNRYEGSDFISIVKIDVDNLGYLFIDGFRHKENNTYQNILSVSRFVSLSRMFNLFFNYYMKYLLSKKFSNFYTVLSGGDDVLLVAPWNKAMDFVLDVNKKFKEFVCFNKDIHFSTGIEILKPNSPINRAVHTTEEHLDAAKNFENPETKETRNNVFLFSPISYEQLHDVHEKVKSLISKIRGEGKTKNDNGNKIVYSTGFMYRLLTYTRMAKAVYNPDKKEKDFEKVMKNYSFRSLFKYDVARNIIQTDSNNKIINDKEVGEIIKLFGDYTDLNSSNYKTNPEMLETIIKIALYETRIRTKENKKED